jgi:hypothetical protein
VLPRHIDVGNVILPPDQYARLLPGQGLLKQEARTNPPSNVHDDRRDQQ